MGSHLGPYGSCLGIVSVSPLLLVLRRRARRHPMWTGDPFGQVKPRPLGVEIRAAEFWKHYKVGKRSATFFATRNPSEDNKWIVFHVLMKIMKEKGNIVTTSFCTKSSSEDTKWMFFHVLMKIMKEKGKIVTTSFCTKSSSEDTKWMFFHVLMKVMQNGETWS